MKRISSRGIIIENDYVYAMYRRKLQEDGTLKEYYVIPGGGVEENETLEEALIRELKEEFSVDVKIISYLGNEDDSAHFFRCEIIKGIPTLGGEELERMNENNYYEIRKVLIKDINNIDIFSKNMINKALKENK